MAEYSLVEDRQSGKVCGLWLRNPRVAQDRVLLCALLAKHNLSQDLGAIALAGGYRVVPNTVDNKGGCFVMFSSAQAPGEKTEPKPRKRRWF
jgi:hypothetical protein